MSDQQRRNQGVVLALEHPRQKLNPRAAATDLTIFAWTWAELAALTATEPALYLQINDDDAALATGLLALVAVAAAVVVAIAIAATRGHGWVLGNFDLGTLFPVTPLVLFPFADLLNNPWVEHGGSPSARVAVPTVYSV